MERYTIKEWKGLKGLTLKELGDKCGVTQFTIRNWIADGGSMKVSHAIKLAEAFGCTLDQINFMP